MNVVRRPALTYPATRDRRLKVIGAFLRDERGATIIEFGLVAMLLILLVFGIIDFAYAFYAKNTVYHAAREGARFAVVRGLQSGRTADSAAVATFVEGHSALTPIIVRTTWPTTKQPGAFVRVRVEYAYQPLSSLGFVGSMTIASTSEMVISF